MYVVSFQISGEEQKWWVKTSENPIDRYFLGYVTP